MTFSKTHNPKLFKFSKDRDKKNYLNFFNFYIILRKQTKWEVDGKPRSYCLSYHSSTIRKKNILSYIPIPTHILNLAQGLAGNLPLVICYLIVLHRNIEVHSKKETKFQVHVQRHDQYIVPSKIRRGTLNEPVINKLKLEVQNSP